MYRANDLEIAAFYWWLQGRFSRVQKDNLLPVYVCIPEQRDELLREYLTEKGAMHRYHTMKLTLTTRAGKR